MPWVIGGVAVAPAVALGAGGCSRSVNPVTSLALRLHLEALLAETNGRYRAVKLRFSRHVWVM
jgi:hypothetical protein